MPASDIIKEYLVSLGVQDNLSEGLKGALDEADGEVAGFVKNLGKQFAVAGATVVSIVAATSFGIAKFINHIANIHDEVSDYAEEIGKTEEEAYRLKTTLDVMGKSMDEIKADPELLKQFQELKDNAAAIQIPDMTQGVNQVKDIKLEFLKLKQDGMLALNWIGFYTMKYLQKPLEKVKEILSVLNKGVIANIPKIAEKIGWVMASVVRLGLTIIRGAQAVYKAIKRIFDMIPKELKVVMAGLAALAVFIRAGPIARLSMIITAALLLLDDFFTYLDGGEALLGDFWQSLIDIYNTLKDNGTIDKFKESFLNALEYIRKTIIKVKDGAIDLFKKFRESGSIEKFIDLLKNLKDIAGIVLKALKNIAREIVDSLGGKDMGMMEWLVSVALPSTIGFLNDIAEKVKGILTRLNDLGALEGVIKSIAVAFAGWKIGKSVAAGIKKVNTAIGKVKAGIGTLKKLKTTVVDFAETAYIKSLYAKDALVKMGKGIKDIAETAYIKSLYAKDALVKMGKGIKDIAETAYIKSLYAKDALVQMYNGMKESGKKAIKGITKYGKKAVSSVTTYGSKAAKGALSAIKSAGSMMVKGIGSAISFFTSPVGLIILAVTALIAITVLIIKNWDKVKEFFIKFGKKVKEIFTNLINTIKKKWGAFKEKFASSDSFFGRVMQSICSVVENYIGAIIDFFKMLWEVIKGIFSVIKSIISGDFQGAYDAVVGIWEAIKGFFTELINKVVSGIKSTFSPIVNWFQEKVDSIKSKFTNIPKALSDKFSDAVDKIKGIFAPLVDWFSEKVEKIKGFFSGIGDAISGITGLGKDPVPTGYAEGGIVTKHQIAQVAEGNKPELIVPLTKPNRAKKLIMQGAGMLNMLSAGINQESSYAYNTSNTTVINNYTIEMPSNYQIYDSSSSPSSTAKAVDRTKQMQIRNLKGIL